MFAIIFLIFIWVLNFLLLLFKKRLIITFKIKDKLLRIDLSLILSLIICIYIYFKNTGSGDYYAYVDIYKGNLEAGYSTDIGFQFLIDISNNLGLDFQIFQGVCCTISLLLILFVYSRFSNNFNLFFTLYFLYQYFVDLNVLRNYIARGILALFILMLYKKKPIMSFILVVFATLIHKSCIVYIPLLLFTVFNMKSSIKIVKIIAYSIMFVCVISFIGGNDFTWLFNIIKIFMSNDANRLRVHFTSQTRFGFMIYFIFHLSNLMLNIIVNKHIDNNNLVFNYTHKFVFIINMFVIISFPLMMMNTDFHRLYMNFYLVNYIYYAMILKKFSNSNKAYYSILFYVIFISALYMLPIVHGSNQLMYVLGSLID